MKIIDFDPADDITFRYLQKYNLFDQAKKERHFINSPDQLAQLVAYELGYTVVTEQLYHQYCDHSQVTVCAPKQYYDHHISLCWHNRGELPSYLKALIDAIT